MHNFVQSLALGLLCAAVLVLAAPASIEKRSVSQDLLDRLEFFSQYAVASYCEDNNNSPSTELSCVGNSCPLVEDAETETVTEFENTLLTDATGFVAIDHTNELIVVSFRGTNSIRNVITNTQFLLVPTDLCPTCFGFSGFWKSWLEARNDVMEAVESATATHPGFQLVVVGHSLGGAIATFAATQLRNAGHTLALYTYGAPRVGGRELSTYITNQPENYRVTHRGDPIPKLPPFVFGYVHISPEYYVTSGNAEAVTTSDVEIVEGEMSFDGNTGDFGVDVAAHLWYFHSYLGCWDGRVEI